MARGIKGRKAKLLRELEGHPIIERACKRVGIARSSYYRWIESDAEFKYQVDNALRKSREKFNDFAESKLIENINANMHQAIVFWLRHNSSVYRPHAIRIYIDENKKHAQSLKDYELLFNELINNIGIDQALRIAGHDPDEFKLRVREELKKSNPWMS